MEKRIAIAVGGTGGHVIPAQEIGGSLKNVLYVGVGLKENRFLKKEGIFYKSIEGGNFSKGFFKGCIKIIRGFFQSLKILKRDEISYVIGFGSFHSLPVLLAAYVKRIPYVLVEFNTVAGKVNRWFSHASQGTLIHFESAEKTLRGKTYLSAFTCKEKKERPTAKSFGLTEDLPIVFVFGGSAGANAIDELFIGALEPKDQIQVIHITKNVEKVKKEYERLSIKAYVQEFIWNIEDAWQLAFFAVCRSGAGSIRESIFFETPALFIPYPYSTNDHQEYNARFMEQEVKGGKMCIQKTLSSFTLREEIGALLDRKENELKRNRLKEYKGKRKEKQMTDWLEDIIYGKGGISFYRDWRSGDERACSHPTTERA